MPSPYRHPRTDIYRLRRAVPERLREAIGKREIKKSLGTRNPAKAKRRALKQLAGSAPGARA